MRQNPPTTSIHELAPEEKAMLVSILKRGGILDEGASRALLSFLRPPGFPDSGPKWSYENPAWLTDNVMEWLRFMKLEHLLNKPKKIVLGDEIYVTSLIMKDHRNSDFGVITEWLHYSLPKPSWGIVCGVRTLAEGFRPGEPIYHDRLDNMIIDYENLQPTLRVSKRIKALLVATDIHKKPFFVPADLHYDYPNRQLFGYIDPPMPWPEKPVFLDYPAREGSDDNLPF